MDVGIQLIFQNTHEGGMSDGDMFRAETALAVNAEKAGFDYIMAPEHHFDPGYSMMPDNMQFCAHLLARTSRIKVGTGAIILPWWPNPLRVAEKISMLDILGEGRFILGFGRGLARQEYETWGVDMAEARGRFDQAAEIILDILDTGIAEYDTEFFSQTRTEIHPRPERGFRDREFFSVAMTPDSGTAAADLGGTMMSFVQLPIEQHAEAIEAWRARWREVRPDVEPGAPLLTDFTYCHEDPAVAEEVARKYLTKYYLSVIRHYDFDGDHWGRTAGYQAYQEGADAIKEAGLEGACEGFIASQCWGTPDQMVEKYQQRFDLIGDLRCSMAVSYAGMPHAMCQASMDLIGERVIPRLHEISKAPAAV